MLVTYDQILQRTLARIAADVDTSQGSFIFDAIAPTCMELFNAYIYIEELETQVFADTATGEFLDRRTQERGIIRREATNAQRFATFDVPVPIGSRWGKEELIYTVISQNNATTFVVRCETAGTIGNRYNGALINIDSVPNVTSATIGNIIVFGVDVETDEELRERYFNSFDSQAFGGNIQDYKEKTGSINGVGYVKVFPAWNGGGTVKVSILDVDSNIPNNAFLQTVQEALDPTANQGEGLGIAPIGHIVTVAAPTTITINVLFTLTLSGTTWPQVQAPVTALINTYLKTLRESWEDETAVVRIAQIESDILSVQGIIDIQGTTINGNASNLTLGEEQIPVIGTVNNV